MPKKQRFFTIKHGKGFGSPIFYFTSLDGAMKVFEYLIEGNAVNVEREDILLAKKPKEDWDDSEEFYHISEKEPNYHLSSVVLNIYTKEEITKIEKERKKKRRKK